MRNLTLSIDEKVLADVRIEAAKAGKSVSRYVSDLLAMSNQRIPLVDAKTRDAQLKALERVLSGPKWSVMRDGRMPTAEERNER